MQEAAGSNPVAPILILAGVRLLILLTNDDGVNSEGILTLRKHLLKKHDICIISPERERTCVAHAITLHKPLRIKEITGGVYSTNGTPADCVYLGVKVILKQPPHLIISGINKGPNMGQDVNYSGTVAAAKEGAFMRIPSLAVSLCARDGFRFDDAAKIVERIIKKTCDIGALDNTFFNVNIPNIPMKELKGFMVTRLGKRIYNDAVVERVDPRGGKYYWIGGNGENYEHIRGTDFYAVEKGYVSITPMALDMTGLRSIKRYEEHFRNSL